MDIKSINYLRDTFKIGYEAYEEAREEAKEMWLYYHNRHYTAEQHNILNVRGQPAETYNVIKIFSRLFLGYYSTIVTSLTAQAVNTRDETIAKIVTDIIKYTLRDSNFKSESEKIKLSGLLSGLLCAHVYVQDTDEKDDFGRVKKEIKVNYIPDHEIVLDPNSVLDDYSDAMYIHRFKWVSEATIIKEFGKSKLNKIDPNYNTTNQEDANYEAFGRTQEVGETALYDKYLLIHSVTKDVDGNSVSSFWSGQTLLKQSVIDIKEVPFPYRVVKLNPSKWPEYYGIFREVLETQKAMNQAVIKLQLLVSSQKAFVETGAVDNLQDFTNAFSRVTAVIPVLDLKGIKIENLSREALDQYNVIDNALNRIERTLGVNDSFLGQAFASDSGKKVKLQQNAATIALRYVTGRIETFHTLLGWDIAYLARKYYTATDTFKVTDEITGERLRVINQPLQLYKGQKSQDGQPVMETQYMETLTDDGEPSIDDEGNYYVEPLSDPDTILKFSKLNLLISTIAYDDEDDKNQLMLEQTLGGITGQLLSQVNPAGFFKAAKFTVETLKTRNSPEIAKILEETANMLSQNNEASEEVKAIAQQMPGKLAQQKGG